MPWLRLVDHSTTKPPPKVKPKTFETQRNRGSRGQKEETGKSVLEEQKPNLNPEEKPGGSRKRQISNHEDHKGYEGKARKIFATGEEFNR